MKCWYKAVCDKCGEARNIMVDNPSRSELYLSHQNDIIYDFLRKHIRCGLRLIEDDEQLDKLWDDGFIFYSSSKKGHQEINSAYGDKKAELGRFADGFYIREKKDE
jgi:hypothetical protein